MPKSSCAYKENECKDKKLTSEYFTTTNDVEKHCLSINFTEKKYFFCICFLYLFYCWEKNQITVSARVTSYLHFVCLCLTPWANLRLIGDLEFCTYTPFFPKIVIENYWLRKAGIANWFPRTLAIVLLVDNVYSSPLPKIKWTSCLTYKIYVKIEI